MMKKILVIAGLSLLFILAVAVMLGWRANKASMKVNTIRVDDNLIVLEGGGGNSVVLTSEEGDRALVVDTKSRGASRDVAAAVRAKDVTVVNTHLHLDHTGGNSLFPKAALIAGAYTQDQWKSLARTSRYPDRVVQPGRDTVFRIGAETVHVRNLGQAHSWNDVVVYLENRKFLLTGDLVFHHRHPALFAQGGTNVASWVRVLDLLIKEYDPARVLPGHGGLSDRSALLDMKEYFGTIGDAIGNPEKIRAAKGKYKNYGGIPVLASFDRTVTFLEDERKRR